MVVLAVVRGEGCRNTHICCVGSMWLLHMKVAFTLM